MLSGYNKKLKTARKNVKRVKFKCRQGSNSSRKHTHTHSWQRNIPYIYIYTRTHAHKLGWCVPAMFVRWKDMSLHVLIFLEIVVQLESREKETPKPKSKCRLPCLTVSGSLVYYGEGVPFSFPLLLSLSLSWCASLLSEMLNLLTAV